MMSFQPRRDSLSALLATAFMASVVVATPDLSLSAEPPEGTPGVSEELRLLKEEETVVTAIRREQPISQAPSNVYVITDEDIRQSGATDLPTLLRRIPGMEVMQVTGADFNVSARGDNQLGSNKLLVMVDGRSIYVDVQATVFWKMIPVTLPEIKRIEVVKGPTSALWGFNAFDGVVHIITKSPEEIKGTTLQFGGGEFGTISSTAVQAGTLGKLGYRLSAGRDQNNQWRDRNSLAFRSNKFNVQTDYALSGTSKLSFSGGLVDANNFDGPVFQDTFDQNHKVSQGYANLAYEQPNFLFRAFWNRFNSTVDTLPNPALTSPLLGGSLVRITDLAGSTTATVSSDTYNVDLQYSIEYWVAHRLTLGVNYRHNNISSNIVSQFSQENRLGYFLQDEWKATPSVTLVGGFRYDLDTFIHPTVSPRLALLYSPIPGHTFRGAISVAYRPPTLFETTANVQFVALPGIPPPGGSIITPVMGSSQLNPEEIVSYEIGYQGWYLKHRLRARADLFFNHISNLISFQNTGATATAVNGGGAADIYGGEAGIEYLATSWLTGFANYSYQEIGQSFNGIIERGAPRYKFNVGLRGDWENGLSGEAGLYYYGAATYPPGNAFVSFSTPPPPPGGVGVLPAPNTRVGSYNLLNLRGAYRFWKVNGKERAEVAVTAFNALNDRHKEHPLGDTIGSRVMGWLTLNY